MSELSIVMYYRHLATFIKQYYKSVKIINAYTKSFKNTGHIKKNSYLITRDTSAHHLKVTGAKQLHLRNLG